jgi:hypothetical protein
LNHEEVPSAFFFFTQQGKANAYSSVFLFFISTVTKKRRSVFEPKDEEKKE